MKEYIKKFADALLADGYVINNIPFTSTVGGGTLTNLTCNLENKKIAVDGDNIIIVNNISKTKFYLQNGDIVEIVGDEINSTITEPYKNTLVRVEIGDNVHYIDNYAFYNFSNLSHITIPSTVTEFGQGIFDGTNITEPIYNERSFIWLPNLDTYKTYTVPSGIEVMESHAISDGAFENITIPDSVTELRHWNFVNCNNLKNVKLSDNLTYIANGGSLSSVFPYTYIENNIKYLDTMAVGINSTTSSITIKDGTKYICIDDRSYNIRSITIPSSVKYIHSEFSSSNQLTNVYITDLSAWCKIKFQTNRSVPWNYNYKQDTIGTLYLNNQAIENLVIPNDITHLNSYAFYNCKALKTVTIPDTVTSAGDGVFCDCLGLTQPIYNSHVFFYMPRSFNTGTTYTIPNGIKQIAGDAFDGGFSIQTLILPNSVTYIGDRAFMGCYNLNNLTLSNSIEYVGEYAFSSTKVTNIILPNTCKHIGDYAFASNYLETIYIPGDIEYLSPYVFCLGDSYDYPGSLTTITIGNRVYNYDGSQYFNIILDNGREILLQMYQDKVCFLPDTKITLADGTTKAIKDITYNDTLKVWNFDEGKYDTASICWLTKSGLHNDHYYRLTFSDGTTLCTTGTRSNHKVYNVDDRFFEGVASIEIGKHVFTENGIVTVTNKEYIEEDVEYYNLITSTYFNCFANGVLTSDRYGNMYSIDENMKFIKDERQVRPYSEFEAVGIDKYWYKHLRLSEQTDTLLSIRKYITRIVGQMLPRE